MCKQIVLKEYKAWRTLLLLHFLLLIVGMGDISSYSIPFRVLAPAWQIRHVKQRHEDSENKDERKVRLWAAWREDHYPVDGDHVYDVEQSVSDAPQMSTRRRSEEIGIPRTSLQRVLGVQFLWPIGKEQTYNYTIEIHSKMKQNKIKKYIPPSNHFPELFYSSKN